MEKKKSNAALVIILLVTAALISFAPLFVLKDAEFGGADDRGNTLIETTDPDYEPWASPILEVILGVGIIAFIMGRFVERKKWIKDTENDGGALS